MSALSSNGSSYALRTPPPPPPPPQQPTAHDRLSSAKRPEKELHDLRHLHESLTLHEFMDRLDTILQMSSYWLETAHLAVFALEQSIKENTAAPTDAEPLTRLVQHMGPLVVQLIDTGHMMEEKYEDEAHLLDTDHRRHKTAKIALTKIQSEWSGLQHFLTFVNKASEALNEKKDLINTMEQILLEIHDMSTLMFQFQEKRHALATTAHAKREQEEKCLQQSGRQLLADMDDKVAGIYTTLDMLRTRTATGTPPHSPSNGIGKKYRTVQETWDSFLVDRNDFKNDVNEDRWQAVFQQVADEVGMMMDGLEKAAHQCRSVVQQVQEWHAQTKAPGTVESAPRHLQRIFSRTGTGHASPSASSSASSASPVEHDLFRTIVTGFDAKYQHFTPIIDKMLTTLASGIAQRTPHNSSTQLLHYTLLQRWNNLKSMMDDLCLHDLVDAERLLIDRHTSPEQKDTSASPWKGTRYRPEQDTSARSRSPFGMKPPAKKQGSSPYSSVDDSPRARSVTPSNPLWKGESQVVEAEFDPLPRKSKIPNTTKEGTASWMRPTKSTILRKRAQIPAKPLPKRPVSPVKPRAPSRQQQLSPIRRPLSPVRRSTTPVRRAGTPSMIPRAKTPSSSERGQGGMSVGVGGYTSPMPQLRQRSSMLHMSPVPPLPGPPYIQRELLKKQSMPMLGHHNTPHFSHAHPPLFKESVYKPNKKDPLDVEVAAIVNANPVMIQCTRAPQGVGSYYFGNELNPSLVGGKKMYACKLMNYAERDSRRGRGVKGPRNKVLVRVGGGWQDLELFLLHQATHY
ncbi:hypothetical protein BDF14DRAFT_1966269 [Spinellus fusiger]|nr:hypothetical protein BDF14DRAFT_1966269 [Spinellus fusiger]